MTLLGIDWGEKKLGLALAVSFLAEPLEVMRVSDSQEETTQKLREVVNREQVEKIVVGISEGESESAARDFGERLAKELGITVEFEDETLTTTDAQSLALRAKISRKKRKELEDAYAACVMLQSYLEKHA